MGSRLRQVATISRLMDDSLPPHIWIKRFLSRLIALRPSLSRHAANAIAHVEFEEFGDFNPEIAAEHFACRTAELPMVHAA